MNVRLGDVAEVATGGTPSRSIPEYWNGVIPWMASGEIGDRRLLATAEHITLEGLRNSNAKLFPPGTVMVAMNGQGATRGKVCVLDIEASCNQSLAAVNSRQNSHNGFLFHVLDSSYEALRNITGDGRSGLNLSLIRSFPIPLPPLPEQRAIANILDSIDHAIEATDALVSTTEQLRDSLLHNLLTRGLPGHHTEWKEVPGLGTIPADWETACLGDVADIAFSSVDKKTIEGEEPVRLCNYTDVFYNRRIRLGMAFMLATAMSIERIRWTLQKGDVIFTKDSETPDEIGIPAYVTETMPEVLCGYHLGLARPKPKLLDGAFLSEAMASPLMSRQFARIANGVTRFGLTLKATNSLDVPLPPLPEQQAIAALLESVDESIEKGRGAGEGLRKLKESASDALLTGRVRVPTKGN